MQTFFEILGYMSLVLGFVFLFVEIKDKKKISRRAAVYLLSCIAIIIICAFQILTPLEQKVTIDDQELEGVNGSLHSAPANSSQSTDLPLAPTGYSIRLSTDHAMINEVFKLYIVPYEDDITEICVYTVSPSGKRNNFPLSDDGKYQIDTETGIWTIYASVTNAAGTYSAQRTEDYVTIEIKSIGETVSSWFHY